MTFQVFMKVSSVDPTLFSLHVEVPSVVNVVATMSVALQTSMDIALAQISRVASPLNHLDS